VRDFPGTYTQDRIWLKENEKKDNKWQVLEQHKSAGKSLKDDAKPVSTNTIADTQKNISTKRKPSFKEKHEFESLEKDIARLEAEKEQLTLEMSNPDLNYDSIERISKRLQQITNELETKEMRWLELSELM
jgi:ATP-binding cassette subfamily F protein uup